MLSEQRRSIRWSAYLNPYGIMARTMRANAAHVMRTPFPIETVIPSEPYPGKTTSLIALALLKIVVHIAAATSNIRAARTVNNVDRK